MTTALATLTNNLAKKFDIGDGTELVATLKQTCFKSGTPVSDAQMTALLIVAQQHGLNPWTKEIYAFPDKNNGIVPVVGVDGWSRIINEHPQFDGEEFEYGPAFKYKNKTVHEWIECVIYRKDRSKPTRVREYFDEVNRETAIPWNSHPKRMHRHKSLIQCARLAFGFSGIFDQDEAERIIESDAPKQIDPATGEMTPVVFDVIGALEAVSCCVSKESLEMTWKREGALAVAAKDKGGHAALKQAVIEKKAALEAEEKERDEARTIDEVKE